MAFALTASDAEEEIDDRVYVMDLSHRMRKEMGDCCFPASSVAVVAAVVGWESNSEQMP